MVNAITLLAFLTMWRDRLLKRPAHTLSEEQFGQLVALNTIIAWAQHEEGEDR